MKKILVVLLILAVAGGAFAQGFTFSGGAWGGTSVAVSNGDDEDAVIGAYNNEANAWRVRFQGRFANADGNAGFNFRIQANQNTGDVAFGDGLGWAWFKAMDGMFTFLGGKFDDGPFETRGAISSHLGTNGATPGVRMDVVPIPGLTIAVGAMANERPVFGTGTKVQSGKYNLGFNYVLPDLARIQGNFTTVNSFGNLNEDREQDIAAIVSADILALSGMGFTRLALDAGFYGLDDTAKYGEVRIGQRVLYNDANGATGLGGGIRFMQALKIDDGDSDPDLAFTAFVQYAVNSNLIPRLGVGYTLGSTMRHFPRANDEWGSVGRIGEGGATSYNSDKSNLVITPSIQFRADGNADRRLEVGYTGQFDTSKDADKFNDNKRTQIHNIWIQMRYTF